jgi:DNA-binding CsgD family transcriptional regulator
VYVWLQFRNQRFPLEGSCSIGRLPENNIVIDDDEQISRRHALIYSFGEVYWLADLGSTNGVFLNDHRIAKPTALSDSDEIRLGPWRMVFHRRGASPDAPKSDPKSDPNWGTVTKPATIAATRRETLLLTANGGLERASESAMGLLRRYFPRDPMSGGVLPAAVQYWLANLDRQKTDLPPMVIAGAAARLVIRFCQVGGGQGIVLLTEESHAWTRQVLRGMGLTMREAEVMQWVAEGKTNAEIARVLNLNLGTVNKHVEHILEKLGVEHRTAAVLLVMERLGRG